MQTVLLFLEATMHLNCLNFNWQIPALRCNNMISTNAIVLQRNVSTDLFFLNIRWYKTSNKYDYEHLGVLIR